MSLSQFSAFSLICFMLGLGCDLRFSDFKPIAANFKAVLVGVSAQVLALPCIGFALVVLFPLTPEIQLGMIIIASCPGGPSANMFSWLARADVPLCVTLTALTSVITIFTIPLFLDFAAHLLHFESINVDINFFEVLTRLLTLSLLPLVVGMLLLRYLERFAVRISPYLKIFALLQLVVLVIGVLVVSWKSLKLMSGIEITAVLLLLSLGMAQAFGVSGLFSLHPRQQRSIVAEVGIQNAVQGIALAAMMTNNLETSRIPLPSILYAMAMYPAVGAYVAYVRNRS